MTGSEHQKIKASHLRREAFLYVRQSTVRQVFENQESTRRQYALRERAVALGWPIERVKVIDSDLGKSGASSGNREGFQQLVSEVGLGRAGIVLGLEVSRLARSSSDWHRLLEICALTDTLILDEDGIYNPVEFNDRLLLGLKGTMSDAELHVLRARLRGGIINQARRGALRTALPVGLVYDAAGNVALDPDAQVRESVKHLFETFERTGSASATVKHFRNQGLQFPIRPRSGPCKGELLWKPLYHSRVLTILHNPRYAGAFCFGRTHTNQLPGGRYQVRPLPRDQWLALLLDAHPGYISWERYEANQRRLRENAQSHGADRRKSPPREGPALLQGMVICGVCGRRMTVRYHARKGQLHPEYVCQGERIQTGTPVCQSIPGSGIDREVGKLLVEAVCPVTLELTLQVQAELEARADDAEKLRRQRVERARYEADLARRRFMEANPSNRLVVDVLEAEWNQKLRALHEAQEQLEQRHARERQMIGDDQRQQILSLATDLPRLWNDSRTPMRERKRMARLLLEDVTLTKGKEIIVGVRFRAGLTQSLSLPLVQSAWQLRLTPAKVVAKIDSLLDHYTEAKIADILNEQRHVSGEGKRFHPRLVCRIRRSYGLKTRFQRLREAGMLTLAEIAGLLNVSQCTVKTWRDAGLLRATQYNDKGMCLYEHPGDNPPLKEQGKKLSDRRPLPGVPPNGAKEVQCEP
jgi:DNA invertase Pin-like site-specific DNA recombinase